MNNDTTPVIAFFNNKGGVGKTSLVYHIAWMFADLGKRVVAADLDPQANLTAAFFDEDRIEGLWADESRANTVFRCLQPLIKGLGDVEEPSLRIIDEQLALLPGDLALSGFEDELSNQWSACLDGRERAFRVESAFWRTMQSAARNHKADVVLVDLGPNLGAINRATLISADYVVVPLSPDLFSVKGLSNMGPCLRKWQKEWQERRKKNPEPSLALPPGSMSPIGYIVLQHSVRLDRPVKAFDRWIARIPTTYRTELLDQHPGEETSVQSDPHCIALIKHYHSLMPMAQEARKPIFHLKPADGAIGAHTYAVQSAGVDFKNLTSRIASKAGVGQQHSPGL